MSTPDSTGGSSSPEQAKKIVVDEDWKSQVQAEKEAAQAGQSQPAAEPAGKAPADAHAGDHDFPPASLGVLVSSLATQAMMALGALPMPNESEPHADLGQAKHLIDLLGVLESKTEGNRTTDEEALLHNVLHELRMAFVAVRDQSK